MVTADQLLDISASSECRYDLIRGELIEMSPAAPRHGRVAAAVARLVGNFVVERSLGEVFGAETGFILAEQPDTVLAPDAAFVRADRLPPDEQWDRYFHLAPDLAVEVISPSDRAGQVSDKVAEYLEAGVRLLWVIEPRRRSVTVYTPDRHAHLLREGDELDGGDVLPGLKLTVAELFR
ncbi:MAG TPA: Uma2 family endonuclease [Chloroflexota bacterium]|jgi:Uma2 family endonuclease